MHSQDVAHFPESARHDERLSLPRRGLLALGLGGIAGLAIFPRRTAAAAQAPAVVGDAEIDWPDEAVRSAMEDAGVPGVSLGVLLNGKEYYRGWGVPNVERPVSVRPDTRFQIGSITKTYVALAAMRLVDQGALDLDRPVREYLPRLRFGDPGTVDNVTMRHLLTHTSGLPTAAFVDTGDADGALERYQDVLSLLTTVLPAGLHPSYSNPGFALAGRVVEAVTGTTFERAMRALVFEPLGMRSTGFQHEIGDPANGAASGHGVDAEGRVVPMRPWRDPRAANPSGGMVSTARDQLAYGRFWVDGAPLLTPETRALAFTPQFPGVDGTWTQALGFLTGELSGARYLTHGGSTNGQISNLFVIPDRGFAMIALTNGDGGAAVTGLLTRWAVESLTGLTFAAAETPTPLDVPPSTLAEFVGTYRNPGEAQYDLSLDDEGLLLTLTVLDHTIYDYTPAPVMPPPIRVALSTPDQFYAVDAPSMKGTVLRGEDGAIIGFGLNGRFYRRWH